MSHKAQSNQARCQNALAFQIPEQHRAKSIGHIHKHDVGFRRTDTQARQALQALGQPLSKRMVFRQAVHMVLKRVQSRSGQNAGLPQAATQNLAPTQRFGDQFMGAAQGRAHRRAQALAEAHGHAVEVVNDAAHAGRDQPTFCLCYGRIEQPCTVQMHRQAMLPGQACGLRQIGLRHGVAVPGIFQRQ